MRIVQFKQQECYIKTSTYENGRLAISLMEMFTHEPVAVATVNLPEMNLPDGYVFIKEWSENKGMTKALVDAGIVEHTNMTIPVGNYDAFALMCKFKIK